MYLTDNYVFLDERESLRKFCDDDNFQDCIEKAYRETIPSLFTPKGISTNSFEQMVAKNLHIFELDDNYDLKYLLAFRSEDKDITLCISVLYVNPKYRGKGIGTELIERIRYDVRDKKIVLVASASPNKPKAIDFFYSLGFISPLEMDDPDTLGAQYVDLLWSKYAFTVQREYRHLSIEFKPD